MVKSCPVMQESRNRGWPLTAGRQPEDLRTSTEDRDLAHTSPTNFLPPPSSIADLQTNLEAEAEIRTYGKTGRL